MKTCTTCKKTKKLSEFKRFQKLYETFSDYCNSCRKTWNRWNHVKVNYGLDQEDVEAMYLEQMGKCLICEIHINFNKFHIDHSHSSGKVRGLLCRNCNWMLGSAKDNINTLQRAIKYLEKGI